MTLLQPQRGFGFNIRRLPTAWNITTFVAGFLVVLVGYTGPILIILQAAKNGGLTDAQAASWLWAAAVGNGLVTVIMSLWYGIPAFSAFPTAGAALLATTLANYTLAEAVGAYILVGVALTALGFSGWFQRALALVPQPVYMAVLAGVLLRFGLGLFNVLPERPFMVIAVIAAFFIMRRRHFRAPLLVVLILGSVIAALNGDLHFENVQLVLTQPVFTAPVFTVNAALSLALPLLLLALSSQYAPGQAVLRASGYDAPINGILIFTGIGTMIFALFGGHGLSLGALTSAMMTNPEAHPDPTKRYTATLTAGLFYVLFGLFGATIVGLFAGFPQSLVAAVAGLALMGIIANSLHGAMNEAAGREAAVAAFLCTAANFTFLGIGAPFWGLVVGVLANAALRAGKTSLLNP